MANTISLVVGQNLDADGRITSNADLATVSTALDAFINASSSCDIVCGEEPCAVASALVNITTSLACDLSGASFEVPGGKVDLAQNFSMMDASHFLDFNSNRTTT